MRKGLLSTRHLFKLGIIISLSVSALGVRIPWSGANTPGNSSPPQTSDSTISILGRDTWLPAGSSRLLRIISSEDMFTAGSAPVVNVSPAPITVNYVSPATPRDLTVSITVPASTPSGFQTLTVTDGSLSHTLSNALMVVDGAIPPPSPAVLAPGVSGTLSIAPNALFSGQTSFSLDLGADVAVGPVSLQPDGSLAAPVSVMNKAIPGTRSIHLTAGPYSLLGERGFAVDFGPLVNTFHIVINGPFVEFRDIQLPVGYTAHALFIANSANKYQGLFGPDEPYEDQTNRLYIVNQGGTYLRPAYEPMFISVFDLSPGNYGALTAVFKNIDTLKLGGLLESGTMLPSVAGTLFVSVEDYPNRGYPGGRIIYSVNTQTGASTPFYQPDWNFDPLETDVEGNLVIGRDGPNSGGGALTVLDPNGNFVKGCNVESWPDLMRLDPLSGKFVINRPGGVYPTVGGAETVDLSDCSTSVLSDGPVLDGGAFGPPNADFGNQFFVSNTGHNVYTLLPVAWNDPDQSIPARTTLFATGFADSDGIWFNRGGGHMLVTDNVALALIDIQRDPNFQPDAPIAQFQPASLSFGNLVVGTTSAPQVVTLTNSGNAPLTFAAILASEGFAQSNTCGDSIAPASDCTITVTYRAGPPGPLAGAITIVDSASDTPQLIPSTGNSVMLSVSPLSLSFAPQLVGSSSQAQNVSLTNAGSSSVNLAGITASTGFAQINNCGVSVAPATTCTVAVTFVPQTAGDAVGTLDIASDDPGGPQSVVLSGTGSDFSLAASSTASTISAGATTGYDVTITPLSGFKATISLACTGAPSEATCIVSPLFVTPDGTNAAPVKVTVETTRRSALTPLSPERPPFLGVHWLLAGLLCLACLIVRRKAFARGLRLSAFGFGAAMLIILCWISCGGSSSQGPSGTPAGTYPLKLTATAGTLTHHLTLNLTVR